ncbi:Firmicu-CTERM sorting domain-containing protein [Lactiplantibacillus nangangensis]|uniref:Firmicu-CTERM sorting domain-containing protein n=1 Tax=Lactiplantibacillus nangangensis TaxID=2559917 RepID=A0ABW1SMI1_9LACO
MKLRKIMLLGAVALGLTGLGLATGPTTVNAASSSANSTRTAISIDGQFSDWAGVPLTSGYSGSTALVDNGRYLNVYVKMKSGQGDVPAHGDYAFSIDGKTIHAWLSNTKVASGKTQAVTVTGGDYPDGTQYGIVGNGYVMNDGKNNYGEFRINLKSYGLNGTVVGKQASVTNPNIGNTATTTITNMGNHGGGSSSTATSSSTTSSVSSSSASNSSTTSSSTSAAGVISGKADSSSKATTTTSANANNDNDNLNIVIDGKFNDWKNVTLTEGYDGYTAMVSDGNYVYVYVKMKYGQVPGYGDYNFDISGKKVYVWSDNIPSSQNEGDVKAVSFTGGDYNEGHQYGDVGTGYVAQSGGHSIAEFKVDISKFGVSSMTGQTITMYNPNIGNEKVTVAGGSTGPILISGIGVVIVGFGYYKLRKAGLLTRKGRRTSGK